MSSSLKTNIIVLTEGSSKIIMWSKSLALVNHDKSSPKKRSWCEMALDDDYEEQQERLRELYEKYKKIMEIRKYLFSIGEYELEEGEVFE